jgi:hypothetical protein
VVMRSSAFDFSPVAVDRQIVGNERVGRWIGGDDEVKGDVNMVSPGLALGDVEKTWLILLPTFESEDLLAEGFSDVASSEVVDEELLAKG